MGSANVSVNGKGDRWSRMGRWSIATPPRHDANIIQSTCDY